MSLQLFSSFTVAAPVKLMHVMHVYAINVETDTQKIKILKGNTFRPVL